MKRRLFAVSSVALLGLFVYAVWQEQSREWMGYQRAFNRLDRELAKQEGRPSKTKPIHIDQVILADLDRVDRCVTCHRGIDNPLFTEAPQPFRTHPGDWLQTHPVDKFGCTTCHQGQGRATTTEAAHGDVHHWDWPMRDAELMQSSCAQCHENIETLPGAEFVAMGRRLFQESGCLGCHSLHGRGQSVSVDLTTIGSKVTSEFDFTHVEGPQTVANYHLEHFMDPPRVNRGDPTVGTLPSAMPNFGFSREQAKALTAYVLSLTREGVPPVYQVKNGAQPAPVYASSIEAGRAAFIKHGCVGCHNLDGRGGRWNPNAWPGEEVPSLVYVTQLYSRDELKDLLKQGRVPAKLDPDKPAPPLWMPPWAGKLPEEEMDQMIDYLVSLLPKSENRDVSIFEGASDEQK